METATAPIIELKQLKKKYGDHVAVGGLNLTIRQGEIFGLLGPNGAGKTTTILMLLGLTEPTSGSARVCGLDPTRQPLQIKRRVGYMPDDVGFYEDRTALDNLIFTAQLNQIPRQEAYRLAEQLLERVGLGEVAGKKVGAFSRGMRQRLGIADVLIKRPNVIILDEPTLGIDPEGVRELLQLIHDLSRREGLTVLLSSHHLHQVQQICDRVGLFVRGELIAFGDVPSLAKQLDQEGLITVELEASGFSDAALSELSTLEDVVEVRGSVQQGDTETTTVTLLGKRDLTTEAAGIVIQSGAQLQSIRRKQYGLDEIYHRYFEGGGLA
ncbi:ABC-2 type transport system ATP-binding protein [Paenibacillus taihuensis]|uniref:ABC-2 type transport system ATP-binding protein n=1 Tax=Paenibacillus taihuensis TaxID=1156355 RepID=A0A3D9SDL0_9BACL|nr:ABC transporter ATP-binding protein [Paenibacillus taihuensis]REE89101.1 ABC-2 type transport system ATP-binding protein [Paenibacillus taihuensis]